MKIYKLSYDLSRENNIEIKSDAYDILDENIYNYYIEDYKKVPKSCIITSEDEFIDTVCTDDYFGATIYFLDENLRNDYVRRIKENKENIYDICYLINCKYKLQDTLDMCIKRIDYRISRIIEEIV